MRINNVNTGHDLLINCYFDDGIDKILLYDTTFKDYFSGDWWISALHYADMAPLWASIQYYPMLWDKEQVQANQAALLTLKP